MRYRLRTLFILLAVGPPMLAATWPSIKARYDAWRWRDAIQKTKMVSSSGPGFVVIPTLLLNAEDEIEEWTPETAPAEIKSAHNP